MRILHMVASEIETVSDTTADSSTSTIDAIVVTSQTRHSIVSALTCPASTFDCTNYGAWPNACSDVSLRLPSMTSYY